MLEGIGSGIGMDSSVVESKKYPGMFIVSTTDFFYPLVENPEQQGRIACANVLSDMYAMGVTEVDNMLMLLASSIDMPAEYSQIITKEMIRGFDAHAKLAGTIVSGGQTVRNPWPIIGGVAKAICQQKDIIMPIHAKPGDVLVLTKPIGTQLAVNCKQWMHDSNKWANYSHLVSRQDVLRAYHKAVKQMMRLNKTGALLMHKYEAHAATDVTGFGIMGHLDNLCKNQLETVRFRLTKIPVLQGMLAVDPATSFRLRLGFSAETSGGLLIALPKENAQKYIDEIQELEGEPAWIVGVVEEAKQHEAIIDPECEYIEV